MKKRINFLIVLLLLIFVFGCNKPPVLPVPTTVQSTASLITTITTTTTTTSVPVTLKNGYLAQPIIIRNVTDKQMKVLDVPSGLKDPILFCNMKSVCYMLYSDTVNQQNNHKLYNIEKLNLTETMFLYVKVK